MSRARDLADGTFSGAFSADSPTLVVDDANNRVGFGTTTPDVFSRAYSGTTVGINSSSGESAFMINSSGTNVAALEIGRAGTRETLIYDTSTTTEIGSLTSKPFKLLSNGTERARFDASGRFMLGCTTTTVDNAEAKFFDAADGMRLISGRASTGAREHIVFRNPNGDCGSIDTSGSSTSYTTSSDYRLKENVIELTGATDRIKQIPVHRFNFITDPDKTVDGFLAHEVADVVPEAITGTKDEVDAEGNPVYQGIDQSKLVPLLTAAIKEQQALIEDLQTRLAALETP